MSRQIILLDLPWTRDKDPRVPLGHACLLTALTQLAGAEVRSLVVPFNSSDCTVEHLADRILSEAGRDGGDVDLAIGVYVWSDSLICQLLAELRRRQFTGRAILGGPQISYAPAGVASLYPHADVFVRGYAEAAMCELARHRDRRRVRGVVHRGDIDLGYQADPDLASMPSPWLTGLVSLEPGSFVRWETQRGCSYRCSFCQHREAGQTKRQHRTCEDRIGAEIDLFADRRVGEVAVLDPVFNNSSADDPDRATRILERFVSAGYRGRLSLQCRPEGINDRFLDACAGLNVQLEFGLQTIERSEWEPIRRGNKLPLVERALRGCQIRGIDHQVSLIFGLPLQTVDSFERSIEWCLSRRVPVIKAFPLMLLRGTDLERQRDRWSLRETKTPMPVVCASSSFDEADWMRMAKLSEALRVSERTHPTTVEQLRAIAEHHAVDYHRWTPSDATAELA